MNKGIPTLIIVSGPPASGKTTLARKLSDDLKVLMLSKDDIKEIMWDNIGYNHEERGKASWAAHAIMKTYAQNMLSKGYSVLIEANFDRERSAPYIQEIVDSTMANAVEVHCIAPSEVLQKRFYHRAHSDTDRHQGHMDKQYIEIYHEKLYIKSQKMLGVATMEISIDPLSESFSYSALLAQLISFIHSMKKVKIVVFVPLTHADEVRYAMGNAGAGQIGNYKHCSFSSIGKGRFLPQEGANPAIGQVGVSEAVEEERIEMVCSSTDLLKIVDAMKAVHPYEEVAFDVYELVQID